MPTTSAPCFVVAGKTEKFWVDSEANGHPSAAGGVSGEVDFDDSWRDVDALVFHQGVNLGIHASGVGIVARGMGDGHTVDVVEGSSEIGFEQ